MIVVPKLRHAVPVAVLLFAWVGTVFAVPNDWVHPGDGLWRITNNWSTALAPSSSAATDPTFITNAGTKTVTIDSATLPTNLSVLFLTLTAPAGSTNTLALVSATNATFTASNIFHVGTRGTLLITNTAVRTVSVLDISNGVVVLDSGSLTCVANCDLQSGSLTVNSGAVTVDALSTGIRMGRFSGANAALHLNGGTVNTPRVNLGSVAGSLNSLNIAGGNLVCSVGFSAAQQPGTTGDVTLSSGSFTVTNGTASIAERAPATFTQNGGIARFANLRIGDVGVGVYNLSSGTFNYAARPGGSDLFIIGNLENGDFNQSGGVAVIQGETHVADTAGVTANVNITGGTFIATNDLMAIGRQGFGTMTVSNATVVLTNTSIGRHAGAQGMLTVRSGANVQVIADFSIGRLVGAQGQMFVEAGQFSVLNDDLWVGRGGTGELTVSGGTVTAQRLQVGASDDGINIPTGTFTQSGGGTRFGMGCYIGTAGLSSGTAIVNGGTLASTNNAGTNVINIANGSLTMNGGTVIADALLMTNAAGLFTFNNGLLRAKTITVSNGASFVIGDGVNPATLELQGGIYTFADGLVISPNATVSGCGTIVGAITNNGTLIPCGPPPATISGVTHTGTTANVSFTSVSGHSYTLEFKNALSDLAWTPILPAQPGTGGLLLLSDTLATNRTRFYRVGTQ